MVSRVPGRCLSSIFFLRVGHCQEVIAEVAGACDANVLLEMVHLY